MKSIMKEMVGGCCVCSDERGWPENPLVYCDGQGCTVAVHQACYGIVTVPTGPWYCRKCESQERSARVRCELCPSKDGALKRTDNSGWAHVVCALYIPEVRFGNVTTMEPIILQLIPTERFNKVCYICEELGKGSRSTVGACMQCNKSGCKQQFHVTCAQALGLLCEEAGNYLDNVKYCGYCQHHYSKLIGWPPVKKSTNYYDHIKEHSHKHSSKKQKKGGNVKTIPPYKPIPADHHSSDSSPEKDAEANTLVNKNSQQQSSSSSSSSSKRKSGSSTSKSSSSSSKSSSSASKSTSSSTSSHQKTVHNSSSSSKSVSSTEKSSSSSKSFSSSSSSNVKSVKNTDTHSELTNAVNSHHTDSDLKVADKVAGSKDLTSSGQKFANSSYGGDSAAAPSSAVNDTVYGAAAGGEVRNDSNLSVNSTTISKDSSSSSSKSSSKKRKAGSRTPTPNSIGHSVVDGTSVEKNGGVSTIVSVSQSGSGGVSGTGGVSGSGQNSSSTVLGTGTTDRRDSIGSVDSIEKPKKAKTEHIPPPAAPPPSVAVAAVAASHITSSTSSRTTSSPSVIANDHASSTSSSVVPNDISVHSTGHTTTHSTCGHPSNSHVVTTASVVHPVQQQQNSLVVSVPLANTTLSPIASHQHQTQHQHAHQQSLHQSQHHPVQHQSQHQHHHQHHQSQHHQSHHPAQVNNNAHVSGSTAQPPQPPQPPPRPPSAQHYQHHAERNDRGQSVSSVANNGTDDPTMCISTSLDSTMVSSETSDGLKITYEKQPTMNSSSLSRLASDSAPVMVEEAPAKRSRSQSADKTEKMGRPKKRGSNGVTTVSGPATGAGKRTSRSQHPTPPPAPTIQPGAFSSVSQQVVKESPPSSPSDENNSVGSVRRSKGRKSAPATVTSVPSSSSSTTSSGKPDTKDTKDIKVFQNGVHAPHMLGNQLNPNSNMAQKMSDHLNSELEAHSIFNPAENSTSNLVGPQLHSRVIASIRSTNSTTSASNSSSGFSSMLGGGSGGTVPQTLDQLLERQWEQGSQFLMEQAQHFDIASLLSCLHQLRAENLRLEEHVNSLLQRRDHLLAVNARLAIPLTNQQPVAAPSQPHTINNLHPSVTASHGDVPRSRHSAGAGYPTHTGAGAPPLENGLPSDGAAYPHQHRSPANAQPQPSPTIRHSPAGSAYPSTSNHGVVRSGSVSESSGRSSQRPQSQHASYPQYQGQVPVVTTQQQPQMVIRRDSDVHHQMPSSKPS